MASTLHLQAEELREKGDFIGALKLYEEVIIGYQSEKNYQGIIDALQGRFLTYKHLFWNTKDFVFAQIGRMSAELSLHIAQQKKLPVAFCYFSLGEASMLFEDFMKATEYYRRAINAYGSGPHIGDLRYHLGEALYRLGNKDEGKKYLLLGLVEIQKHAHALGQFVADVWESGCYLRLAGLLRVDDPEAAKKYLKNAERIIEANNQLTLRKQQLAQLQEHFTSL